MWGILTCLAWVCGIATMGQVFPQMLSQLWLWICLIALCMFLSVKYRPVLKHHFLYRAIYRVLFILSIFLTAQYYAETQLQQRLSQRVTQVNETDVVVYINHLDERSNAHDKVRYKRQVQWLSKDQKSKALMLYSADSLDQTDLKLGQYYRISGKLKPAHSYAVPHVFDQEKWMIQQNIMGTMQVKQIEALSSEVLQQQGYAHAIKTNQSVVNRLKIAAEQLRLDVRELIQRQPIQHKGLILALLTGDESLLDESTKVQFKQLGIAHLLAISGPHVLIFAVMVCFILNRMISTFYPRIFLSIPRPYLLLLPFCFCVLAYTAFVGFEIPALRTCLTVCLISFMLCLNQQWSALKILLLSASLLLVLDPFSILSPAFWLSYGACFILIRVYQTIVQHKPSDQQQALSYYLKFKHAFRLLVESQWKVFLALFPLTLLIFGQVSWLAPLVNLIAIPLIGLLIVPLGIGALCISVCFEPLGQLVFHVQDAVIGVLLYLLNMFQQVLFAKLSWLALRPLNIVLISLAIIILFLPRGVVPKAWSLICMLPILLDAHSNPTFKLSILDVGQGQAIWVQAKHYNFMFDTGGSFDEATFSIADQIDLPFLMGEGVSRFDKVFLSHLDSDHAGAFDRLKQQMKIDQVYSNQRDTRFDDMRFEYCYAGQKWSFQDFSIQVLAPKHEDLARVPYAQNDLSCVFYLEVPQAKQYRHFLIMGDAGWEAEYQLMQHYSDLKVDVLVLGHHGSQHSSAYDFLAHYQPKLAIASAGFNNRYGHPHPVTLARLKALSIPVLTTIEQGSLQFELSHAGDMHLDAFRQHRAWLIR